MPAVLEIPRTQDVLNHHNITKIKSVQAESEYYEPTQEDYEDVRRAEENRATGNYYKQLPGESIREFTERVLADPVNQLVCNMK